MGCIQRFTWSTACAVLLMLGAVSLADCDSRVGGRTAAAETRCPGLTLWEERFRYADAFIKSEDFKTARSILERGLDDCDRAVRRRALDMLAQTAAAENSVDHFQIFWRYVKPKLLEIAGIVVKVVTAAIVAALLWIVISGVAFLRNRKKIAVRPLAVANGGGFNGQHFVAVAADIHRKMHGLRRTGAAPPGISAAAPKMMLDFATSAGGALVESLASEQAGKLAGALFSVLKRPRYTCGGSVYFADRRIHIIIQLERAGRVVESWERSSLTARLTEDLKDMALLALQTASAENQKRWI